MVIETGNRIVDENYIGIFVEYGGDESIFDQIPDATVIILSSLYAVAYVPANVLNVDFMSQWGYSILPNCYGIISQASLEATGVQRIRNIPNFNIRGKGVLIGIVDTGIDYTNPIFQYADKTTRIVSIWDQTISGNTPPKNFLFGTEYSREEINEALRLENPLERVPSTDEIGHGTMLAGIAAGNEVPDMDFFGIATESELIIVKLRKAKKALRDFYLVPEDTPAFSEVDVFYGINYLLQVANTLNRPLVICVAVGTSKGGHDGRGILSNTLSLIGNRPGIAVVVAAGNEGSGKRHYFAEVGSAQGKDTVELEVGENEKGFILELWGESPNLYSIDITSPSGEYIPRIAASVSESTKISFIFEKTTIDLLFEMIERLTGDQIIFMRFVDPAPGIWRFNVYKRGNISLGFHMWLPMEKFISASTFFLKSDNYTTILSLGNAISPITTTAYDFLNNSLYLYASRGYTRTDIVKPEIAAPGVNVTGPTLEKGFAPFTGTSVSAAHTAGVAAMLLEWGFVNGNLPDINTVDIKILLLRGAKREENIDYPNREWGYGILDIYNVFNSLRSVTIS